VSRGVFIKYPAIILQGTSSKFYGNLIFNKLAAMPKVSCNQIFGIIKCSASAPGLQ